MKKWSFIFNLLVVLMLVACNGKNESEGETSSIKEEEESTTSKVIEEKNEPALPKVLADGDFDKMYSNPIKYRGYEVTYNGRVLAEPERDTDGVYLQVYADPDNYEKNTIVYYPDSEFEVITDDYVKITGIVIDQFEGENMLGGKVTAPMIEATFMEVVDYTAAIAPSLNTLEVNKEITQHGLTVKLEKIEFAKSHTRVYVTATNNSSEEVNLFTYSTKLLVGNKQYDHEYFYEGDYPELQNEILPGIESSGIITFPAIAPDTTALKFVIEGSSSNYNLDFKPFTFVVE